MKTYQFTNRHGRAVQVGQEQAVLLYGNPSMKFDGELTSKQEKVKVKDENGKYKMTEGYYIKNKDGSRRKDNKGNYKIEGKEYIYEYKKVIKLDLESSPISEDSDYIRNSKNVVELRSVIGKNGQEAPRSHLNKKSIR